MYNGFNNAGFNNTYKTVNQNFNSGNIAGLNKTPSSVAGVSSGPSNIAGVSSSPTQTNPFDNLHKDNSGPAKQVMNSDGQNMFHNDARGINN